MKRPVPDYPIRILPVLFLFYFACHNDSVIESTEGSEDPFSRNVRNTDPLDPEAERLALKVPEGFEIQLYASEPEIGKPLNMSFDSRGRMWLTQSYEYPFPDTSGAPRDKISILHDTNGDGRADKITTFADSLNIPIGLQVVPGGVIAYSIPNIWHLIDHDGDDKVDERKILYSGFRYKDTHGMVNNFERGWDGWIHADHGFANTSIVAGSDGDTIVMNSGNTFRFRMDGSRVEFTTTGRVNPYGYAFDELGYIYSVDCHTSPVYQLIRGADYPHFGKKPTGIGFGPALMKHDYGSTALAGLEYYIADQFPEEYRNHFYYGDVLRSRVSCSTFEFHGTTPVIRQKDDFIISTDPWFRPVDVVLGPDGALYVADFYNRIIGHYEVPLDHPGRDRQRGRIWRIVYTGNSSQYLTTDHSSLDLDKLLQQLNHPNLPLRMSIADQILDRYGDRALEKIDFLWNDQKAASSSRVLALWMMYRLNAVEKALIQGLEDPNDTVRLHALHVCLEMKELSPVALDLVRSLCGDSNPHIRRQASLVLGKSPDRLHVPILLTLLRSTDPKDSHFYYAVRQSLRDQLRSKTILDWVANQSWNTPQDSLLADVMMGVDDGIAAEYMLDVMQSNTLDLVTANKWTKHIARYLPIRQSDQLVHFLQSYADNVDVEYVLFRSMLEGQQQGKMTLGSAGRLWVQDLTNRLMLESVGKNNGWKTVPIDRQPYTANTWIIRDTSTRHSRSPISFLSSQAMNGQGGSTSIMWSPVFKMPENLQFIMKGRKNLPGEDQPASAPSNRIELLEPASGQVLFFSEIDSLNVDRLIKWKSDPHKGKSVQLKLVDGSTAGGEFIAAGGFPDDFPAFPAISPEKAVDRQVFAADMCVEYKLKSLIPTLKTVFLDEKEDVLARNAAARALLHLGETETWETVSKILKDQPSLRLKELLMLSMASRSLEYSGEMIITYLHEIPYPSQKEVVLLIGQNPGGLEFLFDATSNMKINPRLLAEPLVREKLRIKMTRNQLNQLENLVSGLSLSSEEMDEIINRRLRGFVPAAYSTAKGKDLFPVFCGMCHELSGSGGNIGPQLTGVGNWGARALAEKILDPNRNISKAFVTYNLTLKDGRILSGLYRREEGNNLVFANELGQEFSIEKNSIKDQRISPFTLMPDHFQHTIPEEDFRHLLTYLLSQK